LIIKVENKSVHASDAGQGINNSKDTIVFLHGSGLSHIVWSLTEQFFSNKEYNVLSIDLPGHGNSEGPCLDSIEKIVDWLEKVFKELKLKNLILIGQFQFFKYFF
jgi:pimeloyl-ACP methyl ester carboxylesterase